MTLRSAENVEGDTHYVINGTFRIENLNHQTGNLISFYDPIIFANGDISFGFYVGTSLHILTGGSVAIDQITVTGADSTGTAITPTTYPALSSVETSNGQVIDIDGSARATVDIRAGVDWSQLNSNLPNQNIGLTIPDGLFDPPSTGANINIASIRINAPDNFTLLTNQFTPNLALPDGNIAIGEIVTGEFGGTAAGNAGDVVIDSRGTIAVDRRTDPFGNIFSNSGIDTESFSGNGGDVALISQDLTLLENSYVSTAIGGFTSVDNRSAGNIQIDSGSFILRNGQVSTATLTSGDSGDLEIRARDSVGIFGLPGSLTRLTTDVIQSGTGTAGDLTINARSLLVDSAQVSTSVQGSGNAGTLKITAPEFVEVSGELFNLEGEAQFPGGIFAQIDVGDMGTGGNLTIETDRLNVSNGSKIQVSSFGIGDAGEINIRADEINLFNITEPLFFTGIFAGISQDPTSSTTLPEGEGGQINIYADRLSVRDGARLSADIQGAGEGGDIFIQASDFLEVVGNGQFSPSIIGAVTRPPGVDTPINPEEIIGRGGDVIIETNHLSLREGGSISVSSFGNGDSGDITIRDSQLVEITGQTPDGSPSTLSAEVSEDASGTGGDIVLMAREISLTDSGEINARSLGPGDAGSINLSLGSGRLTVENSKIRTSSAQSSGGDINITTGSALLEGDGDIRTDVSGGDGTGGSINVMADAIIAFDDSDILASANEGRGGDIILNTPAFFGEGYIPDAAAPFNENNRVDVNASGSLASGTVLVPESSFVENSLSELSENLLDSETLVATSCVTRADEHERITLTLAGRDRLPQNPTDFTATPYPIGRVQSVPNAAESAIITESEAIYQLDNGQLLLSRACQE